MLTLNLIRWLIVLAAAFFLGFVIRFLKLPSILGWLIAGMILGPAGIGLLSQDLMDGMLYNAVINWMQTAFGLMLGTELVLRQLKKYGRALVVTTLTQSLGTFAVVSLVFAFVFAARGIPVYLGLVFGSIALATAPAPALSIVREFHTKGPVTDTLLPMAVLDDVVGIVVFFSVNAFVTKVVSGGSFSWGMIPVMILLPVAIGIVPGFLTGLALRRLHTKWTVRWALIAGVTASWLLCWFIHSTAAKGISPNYMLVGVSFSTVFSNMIPDDSLNRATEWYNPILGAALIISIVNLGAPLDYHLILGAGLYTFLYIAARAAGKYGGARFGATITHMPETVQKYLGLTLLPHSGVSLVFTGIACATLSPLPELAKIVQGTIAAAAVINEIIAVITAKQGFLLAGEIPQRAGRGRSSRGDGSDNSAD